MAFVISEGCIDVKDKTCVTLCPVDCIYEGARMLYIHPDECIDCGACQPTCPQDAIYFDQDLPAALAQYEQINREFFPGAPGGSAGVDYTDRDHPAVAALPCP